MLPIPVWVNQYIGIPFSDKGESRQGANCWTLVRMVLREQYRIELPSYQEHYEDANDVTQTGPAFRSAVEYWTKKEQEWKQVEFPIPRDIAMFTFKGDLSHCGLMVTPLRMLHVVEGANACVSKITDRCWKSRLEGFYRYSPP